jgi:histidinol-phosphate aminotransferase
VLLMRTLSKFGLAGVRLGYMLGPKALMHEIDKVRPPYNISVLNYECALFAIEHADVFAVQAAELREQRGLLLDALGQLPGARLQERGQHDPGAGAGRREDLCRPARAQGAGQERF